MRIACIIIFASLVSIGCGETELSSSSRRSTAISELDQNENEACNGDTEPDDVKVDEPVMVGGAFLASSLKCVNAPSSEADERQFVCRLEYGGEKVSIPQDAEMSLSVSDPVHPSHETVVAAEPADADWHWRGRSQSWDTLVAKANLTRLGIFKEKQTTIASIANGGNGGNGGPAFLLYGINETFFLGDTPTETDCAERQASGDQEPVQAPTTALIINFEVPAGGTLLDVDLLGVCKLAEATSEIRIKGNATDGTDVDRRVKLPATPQLANLKPLSALEMPAGKYKMTVIAGPSATTTRADFFIGNIKMATSAILPVASLPERRNQAFNDGVIIVVSATSTTNVTSK